ncbi:RecB family nuclease, putative [Chroococcidiopsis thermalis PCC 7203]|uniref:RecB family nuclease, putative n=2 Tax=Chroococcidiopsis thermalis TaxID=54299 RepID=K9U5B7_CHRTP|nr:RecB family nuclease, putative [Chroococcidiopsis thermalis PCC 7203]
MGGDEVRDSATPKTALAPPHPIPQRTTHHSWFSCYARAMLMTAELLLQYQRCNRRPFLDRHGDLALKDAPSELLLKLQQDKFEHRQSMMAERIYQQPQYSKEDWQAGATATWQLMQQGVEQIYRGVIIARTSEDVTLLSRPDLLIKQPGQSIFGNWMYIPAQIELGKRPKLEYQVVAAFHGQALGMVQETTPDRAWLLLRRKEMYEVSLARVLPQMQQIFAECVQTLAAPQAPEVFISRQRCSLCRWYSYCSGVARSQQHLSLLPGVTPNRYKELQAIDLVTLESLAKANSSDLASLRGFDKKIAHHLVLQAQSVLENRPISLLREQGTGSREQGDKGDKGDRETREQLPITNYPLPNPIEIYFDIEAQPDLNLDYMLGVLVVDRLKQTETFHSLLAETQSDESTIWQQFLDIVGRYPQAPIFHFFSYEVETIRRLAQLYRTPAEQVRSIVDRCVDIYEQIAQTVVLPIESYALKAIARWIGFEWRDPQAHGSQCIYWYDRWLATGDRSFLEAIERYNEDDCRATRLVKDWLETFIKRELETDLDRVSLVS